MKLSVASPFDLSFGNVRCLVADHRLRDALFFVADRDAFRAADGSDPKLALAAALAAKFPARQPRQDEDVLSAFLCAVEAASRQCLLSQVRGVLVLTTHARVALGGLQIVRSSCGATMTVHWPDDGPRRAVYCHYCGALM